MVEKSTKYICQSPRKKYIPKLMVKIILSLGLSCSKNFHTIAGSWSLLWFDASFHCLIIFAQGLFIPWFFNALYYLLCRNTRLITSKYPKIHLCHIQKLFNFFEVSQFWCWNRKLMHSERWRNKLSSAQISLRSG